MAATTIIVGSQMNGGWATHVLRRSGPNAATSGVEHTVGDAFLGKDAPDVDGAREECEQHDPDHEVAQPMGVF